MTTKTYYFPRNQIGRYIINYIVAHVGCSVGEIRRVADTLAVPFTIPTRDVVRVERILQMYDLL